jgi:hypothetical protein
MKKITLLMLTLLTTNPAFAGYGIGTIDRYFVDSDGYVMFGTTVPLNGTCSYYIDQFRFDGKTVAGKNMLATLMAAKVAGVALTVWFTDSTAPGTDHTNGCTYQALAVPTGLGIR